MADDFNSWAASAAPSASTSQTNSFDDWAARPVRESPDEYAAAAQRAGVNVGRSAEEHEQYLRESGKFSSDQIKALVGDYKGAAAQARNRNVAAENPIEGVLRQSLPLGDLFGVKGEKTYDAAKKRIAAGQQTDQDYDTVARYEQLQKHDQEVGSTFAGQVLQTVAAFPKIMGEAWLGNKILGATGSLIGGKAGSFLAGTSVAKNPAISLANPAFRNAVTTHAGRMALLTPTMPSFYLEEARQRNMEAGRSPDDPAGFPGPLLHAYSNMLVLGTMQKQFGGGSMFTRTLTKGAVGVGEQAVADVAGGVWDQVAPDLLKTNTKFGTIGQLARGEFGDAGSHLATQFLTFAAFSAIHDHGPEAKVKIKDAAEFFTKEFNDAVAAEKKKGVNDATAVERAAEEVSPKIEEKQAELTHEDEVRLAENKAYSDVLRRGGSTAEAERAAADAREGIEAAKEGRAPRSAEEQPLSADQVGQRAFADAKRRGLSDARAHEEARLAVGKVLAEQKPVSDRAPAENETSVSPTIAIAPQVTDYWRGTIQKAIANGKDPYTVFERKVKNGDMAEAQARAIIDAVTKPQVAPPTDAQTGVQTPTIAQDGRSPGVGDSTPQPEIVPPGASGESEKPTVAPKEPVQEPGQAKPGDTQTGVQGSAEPVAPTKTQPVKLSGGRFELHGDGIVVVMKRPKDASGHRAHLDDLMGHAIDNGVSMTPAIAAEYRATMKQVFDSLNPQTLSKIVRNLHQVRIHGSGRELLLDHIEEAAQAPHTTQEELKLFQSWLADESVQLGGVSTPNGDGTVSLQLDGRLNFTFSGRHAEAKGVSTRGVWAHEFGHIADGNGMYSASKRWLAIHNKEMVGKGEGESPLTQYAEPDVQESFAEFFRLLHGSDVSLDVIAKDFPEATTFFKEKGFWPKERKGTADKLGELFDEKVVIGDGHGDKLKTQVLEQAPVKEEVPPVETWRDAAKKAGLSDQDIEIVEILGRNMGNHKGAIEKVAAKFGLTAGGAKAAITRAKNRLGATSKKQQVDEFALTDDAKETLKALVPDAKQYKLMEARISGSLRETAQKMGLSHEFIRKQQDKLLTEMGFPPGEKGIEQLREKLAKSGKKSAKQALKDKARIRQGNALTPEEEAMANEAPEVERQRQAASEDYLRMRAEQDRADLDNPKFMRRPDEPMSENEREMVKAVQEDPFDRTKRLILADVIEEGESPNAYQRAADIRREIENPPSERGVSDVRQMNWHQMYQDFAGHPRFREIYREVVDQSANREARGLVPYEDPSHIAIERFFEELDDAGKTPAFKLPRDPDVAFPQGDFGVTLSDFGPRLYQYEIIHDALSTVVGYKNPRDDAWAGKTGPIHGQEAEIEYATENSYGLGILNRAFPQWRQQYAAGHPGVILTNNTLPRMRSMVLSVEMKRKALEADSRSKTLVDSLVKYHDYKLVDLGNGNVRLDTPLRQQLRAEQARGLRTGEPQFMVSMPKVAQVLDRALPNEKRKVVKSWIKRNFTGAGALSDSAFEEVLSKDQRVQAYAQDVMHATDDLTRAVGGDWRAVPQSVIEHMNEALANKEARDQMAGNIRIPLERMRSQLDALTNLMIEHGVVDGKMKEVFENNLGVYLTRQYRAFMDPNWYATLRSTDDGKQVINRFKEWYQSEVRKAGKDALTDQELDAVVEEYLKNDTAYDNPISFLTHSKLGSKDIGILSKRKEIPEPLRALWGEIKDPIANFAASIGRMANLYSNHIFLGRIKEIGTREGWLAAPGQHIPGLAEEISSKDSDVMKPLAGFKTTKEIRKAFEEHFHKEQLPQYLNAYMKVLALTKYAKTVLSPTAHLRQTIGNVFFNVAQGHGVHKQATKMIGEMVKGTEDGRNYQRRLIELGIDFQSVLGGEFRDVAHDASMSHDPFTMSTKITENAIGRWIKKGLSFSQKAYRYEDLIVKIHAFENEKDTIRKAYPEMAESEVEAKAAKIVQDTFPTYSRVPMAVKWLRRFPLVGPFVSFTSEIVRTTYNTAKIARQELGSDNTVIRQRGAKRMAGLIVSMSAFAAIGALSRMLANVTLDEEDAMRRFLPEWNRDSQLLHLGRDKDGKPMVIDLGRTDPHSYLLEPFQAGISGARSSTGSIYDTLEPALKPFIGEEIGTRTALDIARNKMEKGGGEGEGKVYNPEAPLATKVSQIGAHVLKAIEPGAVDETLRTLGAAAGVSPQPGGKARNLGEELLADFTGQRLVTVDAKMSLSFAAKTFEERQKNAEREVNQLVARNRQQGLRLMPDQVQAEYQRGEEMRRQVFDDLMDDVNAARMMGMTNVQIAQELKKSGLSQQTIGAVLGGKYQPRNITETLNRR